MTEYRIFRTRDKNYNRPPAPTYIKQTDLSLSFIAEPSAGSSIFYVPRHSTIVKSVDRQHGFPIDFGLDWSKAKLSIKTPLMDWAFFDELSANIDEYPEAYFPFLDRNYYITNNKGERWVAGLNTDWSRKYSATAPWTESKDITGKSISSYNGISKARFVFISGRLNRVWENEGSVFISPNSDWSSPVLLGQGYNPSAIVNSSGEAYIAWERGNVIYYKRMIDNEWSEEKSLVSNHSDFVLPTAYDSNSVYKEPLLIANGDNVWAFHVKRTDGADEIYYRLSNQDFKFEYKVPTMVGDKSDLSACLTPDKRIFLVWINRYNSISNLMFIFTRGIQSFNGRAAHENSIGTDGVMVPTDSAVFELIRR